MVGTISVIIRNKNDPLISNCISSFRNISRETIEIIIVDSSDEPLNLDRVPLKIRYVYKKVSRFEALNIGVKMTRFKSILIIDSDQIVSSSLFSKLNKINEDMCIIAERSYNMNFIGKLSDLHREFMYKYSKKHVSDTLPVIPRFYKKEIISQAISKIGDTELSWITQHEDSVIYSEALRISKDVVFCDIPIFNIDPSFSAFARKSFKYGVLQARALCSDSISNERACFLRSIDRNRIIYSNTEGFNPGVFYDALKATFYIPGLLLGKIHGWHF